MTDGRGFGFVARLGRFPGYVWTVAALAGGMVLGGAFSDALEPVAQATSLLIRGIIFIVPVLILAALSPAIATLIRRGLAGRFAASVLCWYLLSSVAAGFLGLTVSSLIFGIPFSATTGGGGTEALRLLRSFVDQSGVSLPLLAIILAIVLGAVGAGVEIVGRWLLKIEMAVGAAGGAIGYVMAPIVLLFGISLGVRFGARLGMGHYLSMTLFTAGLCCVRFLVYVVVVIGLLARRPVRPVVTGYYLPTALFAAGTCSSLATLPVNLANVKKVGVRDEVADFVVPFGAVANMDASALMYVAYAPFVVSHVFGFEISWVTMMMAAPMLVIFTIAAPGLPAGMGTALWTATLFASMLGLEDPAKSEFVLTWVALSGGLPDMFRTATNCTGDGFAAILFDARFDLFRPTRS